MICGNDPFTYFPYRSSSQLTNFFVNIDLDYIHDGSTRSSWVTSVLKELNSLSSQHENMPSNEIVQVIKHLLDPDHFLFNDSSDHKKSIDAVSQVLKVNKLGIKVHSNNQIQVLPINKEFVSSQTKGVPVEKTITFSPTVFKVPPEPMNPNLISVMMPFGPQFDGTYQSIRTVTQHMGLDCRRADDIWNNSTFIQDIFDLIYYAEVIIVDFTGKNPNVMYETGIAHTLGKIVIPITQNMEDIPSDLRHHRALKYLSNKEGLHKLSVDLYEKLINIFPAKSV